jgi:hypothetical protein
VRTVPLAAILGSLEAAAPPKRMAWWTRFAFWRRSGRGTPHRPTSHLGPVQPARKRRASTVRLAAAESLEVRLALASDLDPVTPVIDVTASTIDAEPAIVSVTSTAPAAAVEVVAPVTSTSPETLAAKLVFVDRSVPDLDSILASAAEIGAETFLLDAAHDGLGQMVSALAGRSGINAIHIFSHGGPGRITLGSTNLTEAELAARAEDLAAIGAALAPDGDILLYGCDLAQGPQGEAFLQQLAQLTGVSILPMHFQFERTVKMPTWDRFELPLPFSRVRIILDHLQPIPRRMTEDEFEVQRSALEKTLQDGVAHEKHE